MKSCDTYLFFPNYGDLRDYLMRRIGDISQIGGIRRYELSEGKSKGVEAIDVRTGTGFIFTILPSRGMDIAWAEYKGISLAFIAKTGIVSPAYYEWVELNWLRSFFGGLLTTCGLSNVGWPCEEVLEGLGLQKFGLHGRISNTPAENVNVETYWENNQFKIKVSGKMREAILHGENLILEREVSTELGSNSFKIHDRVRNAGYEESPLMILYHINIGYPLLDSASKFIANSIEVNPLDEYSSKGLADLEKFSEPIHKFRELVFTLRLRAKKDGITYVGIINTKLNIGLYVKFSKNELSKFTLWKQLGEGDYVVGLEPGNCYPIGRVAAKKRKELEYLYPGENRNFNLEIGVLSSEEEIQKFEENVSRLGEEGNDI